MFTHLLQVISHLPMCFFPNPWFYSFSHPLKHTRTHTPLHTRSHLQGSLDPVALATYGSLLSSLKM